MSWRRPPAWTYGAFLASFAVAAVLGAEWDARLVRPVRDGQLVYGQSDVEASEGSSGSPRAWQKIEKLPSSRSASYGFVDFRQDKITLSYKIAEADFKRYNDSYGYRAEDVAALARWKDQQTQDAYRQIAARRGNQAEVDAAAVRIESEYEQKLVAYLAARGFKIEEGGVTRIDMPGVVKRNGPLVKPVAQVFARYAAQHRYESMDIIGSVLSFAQTAINYKEPKDVYKGKHTGGILPPITTIVLGWGDCDTKTGMVASILSNWSQMRMIGISVPGHYLMGVLQLAEKGDLFVEYNGLQYVLLEPAGPGWMPPGQVAEETVAQLNASEGYKMYPFF